MPDQPSFLLDACPNCRSRRIGRIGIDQFFCGDCCLEVTVRADRRGYDLHGMDEDGNVIAAGSLIDGELVDEFADATLDATLPE